MSDVTPSQETSSQIDVGRFWAKPKDLPATVYITPLGSWGQADGIQSQNGFKFHSIGGLLGADYAFQNAGVGALIGYEYFHGTIDADHGKFHANALFGQAYGTFLPLKNPNFYIDVIAEATRNWYDLYRNAGSVYAQGKLQAGSMMLMQA